MVEAMKKLVKAIGKVITPVGLAYVGPDVAKRISVAVDIGDASYTDMRNVRVSLYDRDMKRFKDDRRGMTRRLLFLLFHELSHVLFTDPNQGVEVNRKVVEIWEEEAKKQGVVFWENPAKLAHDLINSLEDGRIENWGVKRDKTFLKYRNWSRLLDWEDSEVPENPNPYNLVRNAVLCISTTGMYPKGFEGLDETKYGEEIGAIEKSVPYISDFVKASSIKAGEKAVCEVARLMTPFVVGTFTCDESQVSQRRRDIPEDIRKMLEEIIEAMEKGEANYEKGGAKTEPGEDDVVVAILTDDMEQGETEESSRKPDYVIDLRKNPPKQDESEEGDTSDGSSQSDSETDSNEQGTPSAGQNADESDSQSATASKDDHGDESKDEDNGEAASGSNAKSSDESDESDEDSVDYQISSSDDSMEDEEENTESSESKEDGKDNKSSKDNSSSKDDSSSKASKKDNAESKQPDSMSERNSNDDDDTSESKDQDERYSYDGKEAPKSDGKDYSEDYIKGLANRTKETRDEDLFEMDMNIGKAVEKAEKMFDRIDEESTTLSNSELDSLAELGFPANGKGSLDFNEVYEDHDRMVNTPNEIASRGRQAQTKIKNLIKAKSRPDRRGTYDGMIDPTNLYKLTVGFGDIFMRNGSKVDPDMCCFVLKDDSGSMSGQKEKDAIMALAEIEEIFKGLVPTKITTFSENWSGETHKVIKDWKDESRQSYALTHHQYNSPGGGNYDAFAISIAAKELLKRPEKNKLLIVLSDGQPASSQDDSLEGVKKAVDLARKQGVFVCSFFFGSDDFLQSSWEDYKVMYRTHFCGTTPENLGRYLTRFVKSFIESKI